ncbi:MAG: glycosyltransferase family 4 protein [Bacteroidota bacterium]
MNVLFVSSGNALYGISPLVENQGKSLIDHGHVIEFFTVKGKGINGYFNALFSLRRYLKGKSFDIVHAHYGLSGIIALLASKNLPIVVSFMGDDLIGSNRKDGKISEFSILLTRINRFMAYRFYSYSIVKSTQMLKKLNVKNAGVIPNGVNLKHFYPEDKAISRKELGLSPTDIIIIFVSNPGRPEKNYSMAEEAVKSLNAENVRLIPVYNKTHNEIRTWLNASDLVVLSSYHEGSPNVVKEAMACNCPLVSTDVGDVKFVFGNTAGCFLSAINTNDFAQQIKKAIHFSSSVGKTSGRQRILELKIDSESIAGRITKVYNNVLQPG